jgi:hypothetical protein
LNLPRSAVLGWRTLAALGVSAACAAGCNSLWDIQQLPRAAEVEQCISMLSTADVGESDTERAGPALSSEARALSSAFPDFSTQCTECLQAQCATELNTCAEDGACADFAFCRWQMDVSPAGELRCDQMHGRSLEQALSVTRQLSSCWENGCVAACQQGTRWECLGNYAFPPPDPRGTVTVTQTLQTTRGAPIEGATVRYCGALVSSAECEAFADSSAVSDCNGVARAELPAMGGLAGWTGYRQIVHPTLFPTRLQTNLVIPRSRNMLQQVVQIPEADAMARGVMADTALGNVLFQVFDCAHMGAEGVVIEATPEVPGSVVSDERTRILYTTSNIMRFNLATDSTHSEGGGSGVLANVRPNELIRIRARRGDTGELVAELVITTNPNELLLLEIHPDPR